MANLDNIMDYVADNIITEQGTSGDWFYRKWSNGTGECWTSISKSVSANSVDLNNYKTYPFQFTSVPFITLGTTAGGADLYRSHIEASGTTNEQVRIALINKHTSSVTMGANVYVIGTMQ